MRHAPLFGGVFWRFYDPCFEGVICLFPIWIREASGCGIVLCMCPRWVRSCSRSSCVFGGSRWQEWCFHWMYYSPRKSWLLDLVSRCEVSISIDDGKGVAIYFANGEPEEQFPDLHFRQCEMKPSEVLCSVSSQQTASSFPLHTDFSKEAVSWLCYWVDRGSWEVWTP